MYNQFSICMHANQGLSEAAYYPGCTSRPIPAVCQVDEGIWHPSRIGFASLKGKPVLVILDFM
jgi:hypothetical protein